MVLDGVMDLDEKKSLGEDDDKSSSNIEFKKSCTDCKTTKTPLWRAGPCGPKSLCNACGIRYRKRKTEIPSFHKTSALIRRKRSDSSTHSATAPAPAPAPSSSNRTIVASAAATTNELKMRLIVAGKTRCQRRKKLLGEEEEQAAFSLMALSCGCGSVFA